MSSTRTQVIPEARTVSDSPGESALPRTQNKLDTIREQMGKPTTAAEQGTYAGEAHRLMALYLTGKLSSQQLAFKLRAHNSVLAETIIKNTKNDSTRAIDMREIPKPAANGPGSGGTDKRDQPDPKSVHEAKAQARDTDDEIKKHRIEREQKRIEQAERQNILVVQTVFERESQEIRASHAQSEQHRLEEEAEQDRLLNEKSQEEDLQHLDKHAGRAGVLSRLRLLIGKFFERMLEKTMGGARAQDR